ncbi:PhzF family phenazine biosynthesis protein [Kitasatospora sp. NBC_01287]|uniref:PhzF family phenazine biosynthesis protein n=1 Tax=Kitasatospora sp. NBC_01287 TaxID=2903573 RepID=UPI0022592FA7|nr:PhzF family phenazine biosynthesis protein [Kitasatospora sp. NBC_01287]MCX4750783.1 PhzF family phenazine biosynthesis protein [Kitasatospora sp. NBC_01287]
MRISIIDAFTDRPFAGNPAGVCLLETDDWPAEQWMRRLARELNLSETAFVRPLNGDGTAGDGTAGDDTAGDDTAGDDTAGDDTADWALRWFTPMTEVPLCGHGTLAATHALRARGLVGQEPVRFSSLSGVLTATPRADGMITLDFPAARPRPAEVPEGLAEALGSPVLSCRTTGTLDILLAELRSEHAVRGLAPDLAAITRQLARGVVVTALAEDPADGYDFVSRYFAPAAGVPEDPVTGSAHTVLAPFWGERLGRTVLTGYQASVRGGLVHCELLGTPGGPARAEGGARVLLSGSAVTVLDGVLSPSAAS